MHSGGAFNVVPPGVSSSATSAPTRSRPPHPAIAAIPAEIDGVRIEAEWVRQWPGMDTRELVPERLRRAGRRDCSERPVVAAQRGGASDASHMAGHVALTVDGLGPHGGHAHHPDEYVDLAIAARAGRDRTGGCGGRSQC